MKTLTFIALMIVVALFFVSATGFIYAALTGQVGMILVNGLGVFFWGVLLGCVAGDGWR